MPSPDWIREAFADRLQERRSIMIEAGVPDPEARAEEDTRAQFYLPSGGLKSEWWGFGCARGFVSNSRFGPGQTVIARTNRQTTRRWRSVGRT